MKANPIIAWVSEGGLLAVIALCIILPIALSDGGKTTPAENIGATAPATERPLISAAPDKSSLAPEPKAESAKMVERNIDIINATIEVPLDYTVSEDGMSFASKDRACAVMTDYYWNIGGPIYSLSDVESQREAIVAQLMQNVDIESYRILTAGPDMVGNAEAYQIYFEGSNSDGISVDIIVMAVDGYDFGCYFIVAAYAKGDEAAEAEVYTIIQSFKSKGMPDTTYKVYYAERAGAKVVIDTSLAQGGVADAKIKMNVNGIGNVHEMLIYPTQEDRNAALGEGSVVEIGKGFEFGLATPKEVIEYNKNISGTNNEAYTFSSGGVEWLAYDFEISGRNFSYASAVIGGECYLVGCVFNASNEKAVIALYNQATASLCGLEE